MTYHGQRRQAEDLLKRNYTVSQIAKELGLQVRTVQRWAKELREGKPEPKPKPESTAIVKAETVEHIKHQSTKSVLVGYSGSFEEWINDCNGTFKESRKDERDIKNALKLKLMNEINEKDINSKKIHVLSQAYQRHKREEIRMLIMGREDLLTLSQALAIVQQAGYTVIENIVLEDSIIDDSNLPNKLINTETTSEDPEEHPDSEI